MQTLPTSSSDAVVAPIQPGALADEEVVVRVRAGDTHLFEVLMRRYNQRLYRAVRAILQNDADAEDAVQQAYLNAYRHLGQFEGRARFSTWLTRIAVYEALSRRRRARDKPLEFSLRLGCLCASEVISHIGARPEANLEALARKHGLSV